MSGLTVLIVALIVSFSLWGTSLFLQISYLDFWPRVILGIAGLTFMMIMHIYSIKKKYRKSVISRLMPGKLPTYLNWHIITATIGVSMIFFHAFGSYDSVIAWISFLAMFMVWQSGFIGRYIFVKIPKDKTGLIEEKNMLLDELDTLNKEFIQSMAEHEEKKEYQKIIMNFLMNYGQSLVHLHKRTENYSIFRFLTNFRQLLQAWKFYKKNMHYISSGHIAESDVLSEKDKKEFNEHFSQYSKTMRKIIFMYFQVEFLDVLKNLFKNWHDIHVPLTYLFYTTAVLHVILISLFSTYAH